MESISMITKLGTRALALTLLATASCAAVDVDATREESFTLSDRFEDGARSELAVRSVSSTGRYCLYTGTLKELDGEALSYEIDVIAAEVRNPKCLPEALSSLVISEGIERDALVGLLDRLLGDGLEQAERIAPSKDSKELVRLAIRARLLPNSLSVSDEGDKGAYRALYVPRKGVTLTIFLGDVASAYQVKGVSHGLVD